MLLGMHDGCVCLPVIKHCWNIVLYQGTAKGSVACLLAHLLPPQPTLMVVLFFLQHDIARVHPPNRRHPQCSPIVQSTRYLNVAFAKDFPPKLPIQSSTRQRHQLASSTTPTKRRIPMFAMAITVPMEPRRTARRKIRRGCGEVRPCRGLLRAFARYPSD